VKVSTEYITITMHITGEYMSNFQPTSLLLALDAKLVALFSLVIASLSSSGVFVASH